MQNPEGGEHVKLLSDVLIQSQQGSMKRDTEVIIDPIFNCKNKFDVLSEQDLSKEVYLCSSVVSKFRHNEKVSLVKERGNFVTIRKTKQPTIVL